MIRWVNLFSTPLLVLSPTTFKLLPSHQMFLFNLLLQFQYGAY
jgi:hypothetical protein